MLLYLQQNNLFAADFPFSFTDSNDQTITLKHSPQRIVSLVPSITEILVALGIHERLKGVTYHSEQRTPSPGPEIVGGFFRPDLDKIEKLVPDIIFYSSLQKKIATEYSGQAILVQLRQSSIAESYKHIRLLGALFDKQDQAEHIIKNEQQQLDLISKKTAVLEYQQKQRIMRLMGREAIMASGDDSFQNEFIRKAGGIPPTLNKTGDIVPVSLEQWQAFNPQVLYGCGMDRRLVKLLEKPGWKEVDAVKKNRIFFFPCDLTCRAATRVGDMVSLLAARTYRKEFGLRENFVLPQKVVKYKDISLELPYVAKAQIIESDIKDFRHKTVAISFTKPMKVVSSLEGEKNNVTTVANHYFPPPSWGLGEGSSLDALRSETLEVLKLSPQETAILFTGADMDNLAMVERSFKDMQVVTLVTAGVASNSLRTGQDKGSFYELGYSASHKPGTINILLLTNTALTKRAMTRAIITATEAKTAALADLDIRSSYSPALHTATGTGTDNIIVAQGEGERIDLSGGHTKMGELIGLAVYAGVQEAVGKQNGLTVDRSVFQGLKERKIYLPDLCSEIGWEKASEIRTQMEFILLQPRYADFVKALFTISDNYERGLITDLSSVTTWAKTIAEEIAGQKISSTKRIPLPDMPETLAIGFSALLTGIQVQLGGLQ